MNLKAAIRSSLVASASLFLIVACGAEARTTSSTGSDAAGSGGAASSGGSGGDTTTVSSASSSSSSSSGKTSSSSGSMPDCPGPKVVDPEKLGLKKCPSYVCPDGGGHCVPNALVPQDVMGFLDFCNKDSMCVPDALIETQGNFLLPTCNAIMGLEGRCLSTCIPQVQAQANFIQRDICAANELCVPCYDPIKNEPTGVCDLTCDMPSQPKPAPLPECCGARGLCIPSDVVPADSKDQLGKDSCPKGNDLCVPKELIDNQGNGQICQSSVLFMLLGVDTGVCVPNCVPAVKGLAQGSCPGGYNCAPCDVFGVPTGACGDDW